MNKLSFLAVLLAGGVYSSGLIAAETTESADDAFFRSMLATPGCSSTDFSGQVREALEASTNRYKDLMEDAPAIRGRNGCIMSSLVGVSEPGNYCIPNVFAVYQKDGSCTLKSGFVSLAVEGTSYEEIRAGRRLPHDEQDGECVVLFTAEELWSGEGMSPAQIEESCSEYMASSSIDVLKRLVGSAWIRQAD